MTQKYNKRNLKNLSVEDLKRIKNDLLGKTNNVKPTNKLTKPVITKSPKLELLQANVTNYEPEIEPDNFVGYYIKYNRRLSDNSTDLRNKRESNNTIGKWAIKYYLQLC